MNNKSQMTGNDLQRRIRRIFYWARTILKPIIPIIISISSIMIALRANAIYEDQREIARQAASPLIDVSSEYDENGYVFKVEIINSGGLLDDINLEIFPYIFYKMVSGVKTEYGVYPTKIGLGIYYMDNDENPVKIDTNENTPYKLLAPHTKTGVLYEIRNSEIMNHIIQMINPVVMHIEETDERLFYLKGDIDGEKIEGEYPDRNGIPYFLDSMSLEYMINVEYTSKVDSIPKIERFRVSTGVGFGADTTTGVSIVKDDTMELEMFNIITNDQQNNFFVVEGLDYTIESDRKRLLNQIKKQFADRTYVLDNFTEVRDITTYMPQ